MVIVALLGFSMCSLVPTNDDDSEKHDDLEAIATTATTAIHFINFAIYAIAVATGMCPFSVFLMLLYGSSFYLTNYPHHRRHRRDLLLAASIDSCVWAMTLACMYVILVREDGCVACQPYPYWPLLMSGTALIMAVRINTYMYFNDKVAGILNANDRPKKDAAFGGKSDSDNNKTEKEKDNESLVSTVWLALKLMFHSQPLLSSLVLLGWMTVCFLKPAMSYVAGNILDVALMAGQEGDKQDVFIGCFILAGIYLLDQCIFFVVSILNALVIANAISRIQGDLLDAVLFGGNTDEFQAKYKPGTLTNSFSAGIAKLSALFAYIVTNMVYSLSSLVAALVFLAVVDLGFALFVMTMLPVLASLRKFEKIAHQASDDFETSNGRLVGRFQNVVALRKAIKVANAQQYASERIRHQTLAQAKEDNFWAGCFGNLFYALYGSGAYFLNAAAMIVLLLSVMNGNLTGGEFYSLTSLVFSAIGPLEDLGLMTGRVAAMSGAIHKIQRILTEI